MLFRIVDWYNHTDCKNLICDLDPKYFNITNHNGVNFLMKRQHFLLLPLTLALTQVWAADEPVEQDSALAPVVVTGTQQQKANTVKFNPKATIQPMPAGDGADLLQSVPNMSIIRKGGSSGDPLFRGLGGSRLSVNADDQFIYGGCGMRMDPPTAYIHPNSFDEVKNPTI